ncbi:hypothetical protein MPH47_15630 [Psychrobacillus psychrodurans]|uniref:hypothetical protein n=1 Tax=Psychrobacillus TaxID=1221880 RepID=UPI001F4E4BD7|nr:hypothetical protein [Psychrobacillus psychrodurans]MCK1998635.1 hypothetical protein [Psychrobacillus psychrodurans]
MAKEIIKVDFTQETYDTSKMDTWTKEQWKTWVGEPEDHRGIQIPLINDNNFYLKIMGIYYDEETGNMFFGFDTQNKLERDINIQFSRWEIDESIYNLSHENPQYMEKHSVVRGFQKFVKRTHLESWDTITIEISILDAETNLSIRELEFIIKKRFIQVF